MRTPFGEYIEQPIKGDIHWIPIGFRGGIEDPKAGIVIFNGRGPYDSVLGKFNYSFWPQKKLTLAFPSRSMDGTPNLADLKARFDPHRKYFYLQIPK